MRRSDANGWEYQNALRWAMVGCKLAPDNGSFLNTLGVAQYRTAHYREALDTLTQSDRLQVTQHGGSIPADLAFLAMTHHKLGRAEKAQAFLKRLQEAVKNPRWANDRDAALLLHEAQAALRRPAEGSPE